MAMKSSFLSLAIIPLVCIAIFSQEVKINSTSLTLYQSNYAIVKQQIEFNASADYTRLVFDKFPKDLVENSFNLLFDGEILEQSIDLKKVDFNTALRNAIGKEVNLIQPQKLSQKGKLVLVGEDEIALNLDDGSSLFVKDLEGYSILINNYPLDYQAKPIAKWILKPRKSGLNSAFLVYHTRGLSWTTKYFIYLDEQNQKLSISAYANLQNFSGMDFTNVRLSIVEGEILTKSAPTYDYRMEKLAATSEFSRSVAETPSFEYYKYDFPQSVSLNDGETKLLKIFSASNVPYKKTFRYTLNTWTQPNTRDNPYILISFVNSKANNLGFLIPRGQADFYFTSKNDVEFVGQNNIRSSLEGEQVETFVGKATDISIQVISNETRTISENLQEVRMELLIKNFKKSETSCEIEYLENSSFELVNSNIKPKEKQPQRLLFEIPWKPQSSFNFAFTVQIKR